MSIVVCKFGGSSVSTTENIQRVARIVAQWAAHHHVVVVVSAMAGETNRLMGLAKGIADHPDEACLDAVMATGEQVSAGLTAMALRAMGVCANAYNGGQLAIKTTSQHQDARIESIDVQRLHALLNRGLVPVVTGFQGVDRHNHITTLGRGGSDTTAVALAAALHAEKCLIYTDVPGVLTADPSVVSTARLNASISCSDMYHLSALGAKVLQIKAIELAQRYEVPLCILSTFQSGAGTRVIYDQEVNSMHQISGIAIARYRAWVHLTLTHGSVHDLSRFFAELDAADVDVLHTSYAHHMHHVSVRFSMPSNDLNALHRVWKTTHPEGQDDTSIRIVEDVGQVSIVGLHADDHAGTMSKLLACMSSHNIMVHDVYTNARVISLMVPMGLLETAAKKLHGLFSSSKTDHHPPVLSQNIVN